MGEGDAPRTAVETLNTASFQSHCRPNSITMKKELKELIAELTAALPQEAKKNILPPVSATELLAIEKFLDEVGPWSKLHEDLVELYQLVGGEKGSRPFLLGSIRLLPPSESNRLYHELILLKQEHRSEIEEEFPDCWFDERMYPFAQQGSSSICIDLDSGTIRSFDPDGGIYGEISCLTIFLEQINDQGIAKF